MCGTSYTLLEFCPLEAELEEDCVSHVISTSTTPPPPLPPVIVLKINIIDYLLYQIHIRTSLTFFIGTASDNSETAE